MRLARHLFLGLLLAVCAFFLAGCLSDEGGGGDLPWSDPAGWENSGFGIPM